MPDIHSRRPSPEEVRSRTREILAAHAHLEGPLLPILHAMQESFGFIPQDCVQPIAEGLNIGRAEVHGVITFYHDFREAPAGRHVVKICRAEACQAQGGNALADDTLARLGLEWPVAAQPRHRRRIHRPARRASRALARGRVVRRGRHARDSGADRGALRLWWRARDGQDPAGFGRRGGRGP